MRVAQQRYPALGLQHGPNGYKLNLVTIRYATPKILALKLLEVIVHIFNKLNQIVRVLIAK